MTRPPNSRLIASAVRIAPPVRKVMNENRRRAAEVVRERGQQMIQHAAP